MGGKEQDPVHNGCLEIADFFSVQGLMCNSVGKADKRHMQLIREILFMFLNV